MMLRPGLVGSRADQNMADALLSHFKIPWHPCKECVDFSLLEKRNFISPIWHGDPVDVSLGVQTYIRHEHRDKDFRIADAADHLFTFEVTRGTNVLARDQFDAGVVVRRQDRKLCSFVDETDVGRGERKCDVYFAGKKRLWPPVPDISRVVDVLHVREPLGL